MVKDQSLSYPLNSYGKLVKRKVHLPCALASPAWGRNGRMENAVNLSVDELGKGIENLNLGYVCIQVQLKTIDWVSIV